MVSDEGVNPGLVLSDFRLLFSVLRYDLEVFFLCVVLACFFSEDDLKAAAFSFLVCLFDFRAAVLDAAFSFAVRALLFELA